MARDMVTVRGGRRNQYLQEPDARIGRSQFDRSHQIKKTFDASYLYPIMVDEVLPGDTFTCRLNGFCRVFSPLDAPIMDNIALETFFFFVPKRLLWTNWAAFNGEHDAAGAQDTDYTIPVMGDGVTVSHDNAYAVGNLMAHMGLPHGLQTTQVPTNSLPLRAYNRIFHEWFRDQNVKNPPGLVMGDGPDTTSYYQIWKSFKKHDYFTSCLPYLQKGDAVSVGLTGNAPVLGIGGFGDPDAGATSIRESDGDARNFVDHWSGADVFLEADAPEGYPTIYADLSSVSGVSINALRESVAIQRLLEKDARGGTRYVEMIKAHFGVTSPDYRLQRPEFLGGGKSWINVSPVANTSATATEEQGNLAGVGTGVISGHGWAKSFTEHGYIIGLIRARGDLTYFQGVDRMWSRSTRYDFYLPVLANLGEQAVLNKEIYVSNSAATDDAVFGYQERWAEYRFKKSEVHGLMNPDAASALSFWHLAEDFSSLPALNSTFLEDQTPMARVTAVDTGPDFLLDLAFDYKCARPIPVHSIPSLTSGRF